MACACKTNRDIAYLQKNYGVTHQKGSKETNIRGSFNVFLKKILAYTAVVVFLPITITIVLIQLFGHKIIKIDKFKNVRK